VSAQVPIHLTTSLLLISPRAIKQTIRLSFLRGNRLQIPGIQMKAKLLNYDANSAIDQYCAETTISKDAPYSEVVNWIPMGERACPGDIEINVKRVAFNLDPLGEVLPLFKEGALHEFIQQGRTTLEHNEELVRVSDVVVNDNETVLSIQKCTYHDQVKSNLVLDWEGMHAANGEGFESTLRGLIAGKYKENHLPPLNTELLANSLGASVIVLYRENERLVPYLPLRSGGNKGNDSKKSGGANNRIVALHEGTYAASASGAVRWNPGQSFKDLITSNILREAEEELGLYYEDFETFEPLALSREFVRAGKPQVFFGAITHLSKQEIDARRNHRASRELASGGVVETERKTLEVNSIYDLKKGDSFGALNTEAVANLHYAKLFAKAYGLGRYELNSRSKRKSSGHSA